MSLLTEQEVTELCELARGNEQNWGMFVRTIEAKYRNQNQHICANVVKECITNLQSQEA